MKASLQGILIFLLLVVQCTSLEKVTTTINDGKSSRKAVEPVVVLNSSNFDRTIKKDNSVWLIEFYAPWCGHCKRFASSYESIGHVLHSQNDGRDRNIMVGKIDGASERALSSRFSVRGFPSFYVIDGWKVYQYKGVRSVEALVTFVTEGYQETEPIPFMSSPFGPMGQLRAHLMYAGSTIFSIYDYLVNVKGFSATIASMLIAGVGVFIGIFSIITIGLMTVPKPKQD